MQHNTAIMHHTIEEEAVEEEEEFSNEDLYITSFLY